MKNEEKKYSIETTCVEVVNLLLTGKGLIASERDNLNAGSHHEEGHVETNLVVTSTGRAVSDGISANLLGIACDGQCLEDTLRAY